MDADIERLSVCISKSPDGYDKEFRGIVRMYEALVALPIEPPHMGRVLRFLSAHYKLYDTEFPLLALTHLTCGTNLNGKLIALLVQFRRKRLISSKIFFHFYATYSRKLDVSKTVGLLESDSLDPIILFLQKGNEKQQCYSMYMLISMYETGHRKRDGDIAFSDDAVEEFIRRKRGHPSFDELHIPLSSQVGGSPDEIDKTCERLILDGLFSQSFKVSNVSHLYMLGKLDVIMGGRVKLLTRMSYAEAKSLAGCLMKKCKREIKVKRLGIVNKLNKRYDLGVHVGAKAIRIMDPSRDDLDEVVSLIIDSIDESELNAFMSRVIDCFCSRGKESDMILYGIDIIRRMADKFNIDESILEAIDTKDKSTRTEKNRLLKKIRSKKEESEHDEETDLPIRDRVDKAVRNTT